MVETLERLGAVDDSCRQVARLDGHQDAVWFAWRNLRDAFPVPARIRLFPQVSGPRDAQLLRPHKAQA